MRVGLYTCCSVEDSPLDPQRKALSDYAAQHAWEPTEFVDRELADHTDTPRPGLDALLAAARSHEIDIVVVTRLDRIGHSFKQLLDILGQLESAGIAFASIEDGIETRKPVHRLIAKIRRAADRCGSSGGRAPS